MVVVVESARTQANIPNVRGSEDGFEFFAGRGVGAGAADGHAGRCDSPLHSREHIAGCGLPELDTGTFAAQKARVLG